MYGNIALDLDGVVTDIAAGLGTDNVDLIFNALFTQNHTPELDHLFANPLFWRNLMPIKDAWHAVNQWFYGGFHIMFVTARRSDASINEINSWLDGWNIPYSKVFVCNQMEKIDVLREIEPVLFVDDNPFEIKKITENLDNGCRAIVAKTWYNQHLIEGLESTSSLLDIGA